LLARLEKLHAVLLRRGKTDQARDLKDRLLLAEMHAGISQLRAELESTRAVAARLGTG